MVPNGWQQAQSMSFLNIWGRAIAMMPPAMGGGNTAEMFMCVAFEETRFCNRVQKGFEALAAKYDNGSTLNSHDTASLQNVGVGYTQVQIRNPDKAQIISNMALDPARLKFRDVTASHDVSIQLGLRYLASKGIGGQVGGHPRRAEFMKAWPVAAAKLQKALRSGELKDVISALNSAILDSGNRVPHNATFAPYWNFLFPPGEQAILFSAAARALA
ncbi:MAG TPA: hypothetical protein VHU40_09870 [Polyangia bacterium]|jgi:hypothetical protein|nr:hypothetical protein [Polyangia bacterium]